MSFSTRFSPEEFEQLVVEALEALPEFFQQKLQNIEVVVADWPTESERRAVGLKPGQLLFGLYQGVPLTRRGSHYGLVLPDKITIYRLPIERVCRTREEVISTVQHTVRHEIAHHFGISDDRLRELGAY
ncbi:MAG: metallopeptidase family protein [Chloroflexi bacterium]|nr:MAG: metallopeptidase family protein [Chloroflexota bacterium]